MSIGARIASARKALGYSQAAFATHAGVSLSSQKRYEKDERDPDTTYLSAISNAGVDVAFILTGKQPDSRSELMGLRHALSIIQTFLGFGKGRLRMEFEEAIELSCRGARLFWQKPDQNDREADQLDLPLRGALLKSPALLDRFQLAEVIGKVEQTCDKSNLRLSSQQKADVIYSVYTKERETEMRFGFQKIMETINIYR